MPHPYEICFLATAIHRPYEEFLIPFALFALHSHPRGFVEMIVEDRMAFAKHYADQLRALEATTDRFGLREFSRPRNHHIPNTFRFFEQPITKATYTYVMDVDVMLLEDIVPWFTSHFPTPEKVVNNIIRKNSMHLTGMHFVRSEVYFTPRLHALQEKYYHQRPDAQGDILTSDERVLYHIVDEYGALPPLDYQQRRIHGIHFSPNRGPGQKMNLATSAGYRDKFIAVLDAYPEFKSFANVQRLWDMLSAEFRIRGEAAFFAQRPGADLWSLWQARVSTCKNSP